MDKKNIVFIATSLDGYIADKNGGIDWLHSIPNPQGDDMGFSELMTEIDAIVMGRTTYEKVLSFGIDWPYTKPVFVLSRSLKTVPQELHEKVFLLEGTPSDILKEIHSRNYFRLYIDGGRTVQDFLKNDLIDELRITKIPILLGGGFPLFNELNCEQEYELIHSKIYLKQIVQSHYRRKK